MIRPSPFRAILLPLLLVAGACSGEGDPSTMTQDELLDRLGSDDAPIVLDVRTPAEYQSGHVPGAYNLEDRQVPARIQELMQLKDREIVVYCEVGPRSRWVESYLKQQGFTNVRHLQGDMSAWRNNGHPVQ